MGVRPPWNIFQSDSMVVKYLLKYPGKIRNGSFQKRLYDVLLYPKWLLGRYKLGGEKCSLTVTWKKPIVKQYTR